MSQYKDLLAELDNNLKDKNAPSQEPTWIMRIKGSGSGEDSYLTSSEFDKSIVINITTAAGSPMKIALSQFAPVYEHQFSLTRSFRPEGTATSILPGGLIGHELKVVTPFTSLKSKLHEHFAKNILVPSVHLVRIMAGGVKAPDKNTTYQALSIYEFSSLFITGLASNDDYLCLALRYASVSHVQNKIDPLTGILAGKDKSQYHNLVNGDSAKPAKTPA